LPRPVLDHLNGKFGDALSKGELDGIHKLVGGHPYLTRLAFWRLNLGGGVNYPDFEQRAADDDGPFGEHLRATLSSLGRSPALLDALRRLVRDGVQPAPQTAYKLQAFGVVEAQGGLLKMMNELYIRFFRRVLT